MYITLCIYIFICVLRWNDGDGIVLYDGYGRNRMSFIFQSKYTEGTVEYKQDEEKYHFPRS
jgi:hypothetical protein